MIFLAIKDPYIQTFFCSQNVKLLVTQGGFEPTTYRLEGGCSIQLSY